MIGVFDSGVGGLTVVKAIKEIKPSLPLIYFGDTARVPWGDKSPETIREYSHQICDFLISKKVDEIIIACNTASSVAGNYLREKFPDIKIIDVVSPTISAIEKNKNVNKVAVIGTKAVIASQFYDKKIKEAFSDIEVKSKACPLFVSIVEEGWHEESFAEEVAEKYLKDIRDWKPDVLVLGCTHYPLLKKTIKKVIGGNVKVIDSASPVADYIKNDNIIRLDDSVIDQFYFSDLSPHYQNLIEVILGSSIDSKQLNL